MHATLDLNFYLVKKLCGHGIAAQSVNARLIETPRAWQAGFAIVRPKTDHGDERISSAQEWMHRNYRKAIPPATNLTAISAAFGFSGHTAIEWCA